MIATLFFSCSNYNMKQRETEGERSRTRPSRMSAILGAIIQMDLAKGSSSETLPVVATK